MDFAVTTLQWIEDTCVYLCDPRKFQWSVRTGNLPHAGLTQGVKSREDASTNHLYSSLVLCIFCCMVSSCLLWAVLCFGLHGGFQSPFHPCQHKYTHMACVGSPVEA